MSRNIRWSDLENILEDESLPEINRGGGSESNLFHDAWDEEFTEQLYG